MLSSSCLALTCLRQGGLCSGVLTGHHRRSPMGEAISSKALKVGSSCLVLLEGGGTVLCLSLAGRGLLDQALFIHEQTPKKFELFRVP